MKSTQGNDEMAEVEKKVLRKRWSRAIQKGHSPGPLNQERADMIFKAYFNNKMTILFCILQKRKPEPDSLASLKAVIFLEDLYHHMLCPEYQKTHGRVFQWLKLFFKRFPYVKPLQKRKAVEYLGIVYTLFGMKLKINI